MKSLIVFTLILGALAATNNPDTIELSVVIHDYFPCTTSQWSSLPINSSDRSSDRVIANCNPDIQPIFTSATGWGGGLSNPLKNMVSSTLKSNRKMSYIKGEAPKGQTTAQYQTQNAASFDRWWNTGSNFAGNYDITHSLIMNLDKKTGLYQIRDNAFYPIDNQGWGNNGNGDFKAHNWGFCVEAHAAFIYNSSATLSFQGDDDLWIFLNNQLIFDIGGIHTAAEQTTKLGDVTWATPMKDFASYPFDMFYCERQTDQSNLILTSTVNIYCPNNQYDACGVCQGKGDCCKNRCVSPDKCTIGTVNPQDCTCNWDYTSKYTACKSLSNACTTSQCDGQSLGNTGECVFTNRTGPAYNGCQQQSCDTTKGFITTTYNPCQQNANATCFPNLCVVNGTSYTCNNITTNQCQGACQNFPCPKKPCTITTCLNKGTNTMSEDDRTCTDVPTLPANNTCFGYTCAADNTTFITTPLLLCANSSNLCYNSTCDVDLGRCTDRIYRECNDGNNCTRDFCVESTGECQFDTLSLPSDNNTCIVASCDPIYGVTATNISCKGINCRQDPNTEGCCICEGLPLAAIVGLSAGAIAGIAVGGAAAAGLAGFGGKKAYDYFEAGGASAGGLQNNPMYTPSESGGANPTYEAPTV